MSQVRDEIKTEVNASETSAKYVKLNSLHKRLVWEKKLN